MKKIYCEANHYHYKRLIEQGFTFNSDPKLIWDKMSQYIFKMDTDKKMITTFKKEKEKDLISKKCFKSLYVLNKWVTIENIKKNFNSINKELLSQNVINNKISFVLQDCIKYKDNYFNLIPIKLIDKKDLREEYFLLPSNEDDFKIYDFSEDINNIMIDKYIDYLKEKKINIRKDLKKLESDTDNIILVVKKPLSDNQMMNDLNKFHF